MARAPETGFYFEPIGERLALVVEGSPFPSDDHWAWLGDPIAMTPEQAQLLVAVRWPGIDPSELDIEFDLNFERAVQAKEELEAEQKQGHARVPLEFDLDIDLLLAQAEELREQVRQVSIDAPSSLTAEAAEEASHLRELIARARELTEPPVSGHRISVPQAPPQSEKLVRGQLAMFAPPPPALPAGAFIPAEPEGEFIPAAKPTLSPAQPKLDAAKPKPDPAQPPPPSAPPRNSKTQSRAARPPAPPILELPPAQLEPPATPKPEGKQPPRRPNIRDKR